MSCERTARRGWWRRGVGLPVGLGRWGRVWLVAWAAVVGWGERLVAGPVTALVFAPDDAVLVAGEDRKVTLRGVPDGERTGGWECGMAKVTSLAFEPAGRVLAVGGGDPGSRGGVQCRAWPEGTVRWETSVAKDVVTGVAWSRDGRRLGASGADQRATVWDWDGTGAPTKVFELEGHSGPVQGIAFSPSGESIVTVGADRSVKVWSARDGTLRRSFGHHTEAVQGVAFRPWAGSGAGPVACATGAADGTVRVWQPELGRMVRIVRGLGGGVLALAWGRDGEVLYAAGKGGVIREIDGESDAVRRRWPAHEDWVYALATSRDGRWLASSDWRGTIRVRDVTRP